METFVVYRRCFVDDRANVLWNLCLFHFPMNIPSHPLLSWSLMHSNSVLVGERATSSFDRRFTGATSGICGIFVGFSLIAVVEFAYFVGLFVFELLKRPDSSGGNEKRADGKQPPIQTIYWGELYSYARATKNQRDRTRGKY